LSSDGGSNGVLLDIRGVVKRFGGIQALDETAFDVKRGSITSLIGPNGAGKTTLFHAVTGFYKPDRGEITFGGTPIAGKAPHQIANLGLVRTFQITKALTRMSVFENMLLAGSKQPGEQLWGLVFTPRAARRREQELEEKAWELLRLVRLDRLAHDYAGTLSGGQRKLLEFGRALMTDPTLVLLDEPMAGVNPALGLELLDHMQKLRDEEGLTFLFIEHDMEVVMNVSERVVVMNEGHVIADGPPGEVRQNEQVVDAYLGAHHEKIVDETAEEPS
jgi:neutral amino acid transport system ATP-binding protein